MVRKKTAVINQTENLTAQVVKVTASQVVNTDRVVTIEVAQKADPAVTINLVVIANLRAGTQNIHMNLVWTKRRDQIPKGKARRETEILKKKIWILVQMIVLKVKIK